MHLVAGSNTVTTDYNKIVEQFVSLLRLGYGKDLARKLCGLDHRRGIYRLIKKDPRVIIATHFHNRMTRGRKKFLWYGECDTNLIELKDGISSSNTNSDTTITENHT